MVADLFHYGHVEFLRKAHALGDYLLVGICSDEAVQTNKRIPILKMEERVASVAGCRYVDEVVGDAPWVMDRAWIEKHKIDLVVHGDDYAQDRIECRNGRRTSPSGRGSLSRSGRSDHRRRYNRSSRCRPAHSTLAH